jgi:hypothetical protein
MSRGRWTDHDHLDQCNGLCAVGDHGEDGRQKIAGSDERRRVQKREGRAGDQEEQEVLGNAAETLVLQAMTIQTLRQRRLEPLKVEEAS